MKRISFISIILILFAINSFAQNELERFDPPNSDDAKLYFRGEGYFEDSKQSWVIPEDIRNISGNMEVNLLAYDETVDISFVLNTLSKSLDVKGQFGSYEYFNSEKEKKKIGEDIILNEKSSIDVYSKYSTRFYYYLELIFEPEVTKLELTKDKEQIFTDDEKKTGIDIKNETGKLCRLDVELWLPDSKDKNKVKVIDNKNIELRIYDNSDKLRKASINDEVNIFEYSKILILDACNIDEAFKLCVFNGDNAVSIENNPDIKNENEFSITIDDKKYRGIFNFIPYDNPIKYIYLEFDKSDKYEKAFVDSNIREPIYTCNVPIYGEVKGQEGKRKKAYPLELELPDPERKKYSFSAVNMDTPFAQSEKKETYELKYPNFKGKKQNRQDKRIRWHYLEIKNEARLVKIIPEGKDDRSKLDVDIYKKDDNGNYIFFKKLSVNPNGYFQQVLKKGDYFISTSLKSTNKCKYNLIDESFIIFYSKRDNESESASKSIYYMLAEKLHANKATKIILNLKGEKNLLGIEFINNKDESFKTSANRNLYYKYECKDDEELFIIIEREKNKKFELVITDFFEIEKKLEKNEMKGINYVSNNNIWQAERMIYLANGRQCQARGILSNDDKMDYWKIDIDDKIVNNTSSKLKFSAIEGEIEPTIYPNLKKENPQEGISFIKGNYTYYIGISSRKVKDNFNYIFKVYTNESSKNIYESIEENK